MNTTNNIEDEHALLTLEEARSRLRISLWSLRRLVDDGSLATVDIGRRRFIRTADIDEFVTGRAEGRRS